MVQRDLVQDGHRLASGAVDLDSIDDNLGDLLARRVVGIQSRRDNAVGGRVCVEFRTAVGGDRLCRHPLVYLDGAVVPVPLDLFESFTVSDLEWVPVIPPSQAGSRYGPGSVWGVIPLETRRGGARRPRAALTPTRTAAPGFDWSLEAEPCRSARVYASAFVGNSLGLAAGLGLASRCLDLGSRRIRPGDENCGAGMLVGTGVAASVLPALAGALAARIAGKTNRSEGILRYSMLIPRAVFIRAYMMTASNDKPDQRVTGLEVAGLIVATVGAPGPCDRGRPALPEPPMSQQA